MQSYDNRFFYVFVYNVARSKNWKIVGDNLDLSVKVEEMRVDSNDQLLHFFHYYTLQIILS